MTKSKNKKNKTKNDIKNVGSKRWLDAEIDHLSKTFSAVVSLHHQPQHPKPEQKEESNQQPQKQKGQRKRPQAPRYFEKAPAATAPVDLVAPPREGYRHIRVSQQTSRSDSKSPTRRGHQERDQSLSQTGSSYYHYGYHQKRYRPRQRHFQYHEWYNHNLSDAAHWSQVPPQMQGFVSHGAPWFPTSIRPPLTVPVALLPLMNLSNLQNLNQSRRSDLQQEQEQQQHQQHQQSGQTLLPTCPSPFGFFSNSHPSSQGSFQQLQPSTPHHRRQIGSHPFFTHCLVFQSVSDPPRVFPPYRSRSWKRNDARAASAPMPYPTDQNRESPQQQLQQQNQQQQPQQQGQSSELAQSPRVGSTVEIVLLDDIDE
ncbi:hypothetical protein BGZ96_011923 [Linnemannia gamsii]|uniref:Uncharacterized protein n=1 Tax=Linnemannia gamsii TaxID=64522 RepID=A0ABQ7KCJ8_9FUNG|nr:hypothetical protein BGZ96_011923 [Linnemannia gamsii]